MPLISLDTLAILRKHDTPTICNALEHAMGGRTAEGFTKSPVVCADPSLPPIVGFARTAKIRASSPAQKPAAEVRALRMDYYEYVAGRRRAQRRRHRGHRLAPLHRRLLGRDAGGPAQGPRRRRQRSPTACCATSACSIRATR